MGKGQELYIKAKGLILGGTHLLSKSPERYLPGLWPTYFDRASGCELYDLDGNKYIDMTTMSLGACILGYADRDVNEAVQQVIDNGNISTLNPPEEVELAEKLCSMHTWAEMVRYTRTGGEAMAVAVRIARSASGKDIVLCCGYHGWHDWFLAANLGDHYIQDEKLMPGLPPKGVPRALKGTAFTFNFNDTTGFLGLIDKHRDDIGVVVMEPVRNYLPADGFLETIRQVTKELGIVLVFDEISAGFRLTVGGAHLTYGVEPDIAVFGKAISNGFPMAAVIGRRDVMKAAEDAFISSTYWTDRVGPVAALATIKKMQDNNSPQYLMEFGNRIQQGWKTLSNKHNLMIDVSGIPPLASFSFGKNKPLVLKTLFIQLMLEKGFLATTQFYASCAHNKYHLEKYIEAVDESFGFISKAIKTGQPEKFLKTTICQSGFSRLT